MEPGNRLTPWVTLRELAVSCCCSIRTLYRDIAAGELCKPFRRGRLSVVPIENAEAYRRRIMERGRR